MMKHATWIQPRSEITVFRFSFVLANFPTKRHTLIRVRLRGLACAPRATLAPWMAARLESAPCHYGRDKRVPPKWRSRPPLRHDRYIVSVFFFPPPADHPSEAQNLLADVAAYYSISRQLWQPLTPPQFAVIHGDTPLATGDSPPRDGMNAHC